MSLRFHWFLPTSGDGRAIIGRGHSLPHGHRAACPSPGRDHGSQAAATADPAAGHRLPRPRSHGRRANSASRPCSPRPARWCEDAWLVTAALISQTERLKFLVAFRPGLTSPTLAAQMAATYQRISGGRLMLNVVTGGQADEQARFGDYLPHDQRYARTGEFLEIDPRRVERHAVRLRRRALPGRGRDRDAPAGPAARTSTSAARRRRRGRSPPATSTST